MTHPEAGTPAPEVDLLPSVRSMSGDVPQRIGFPAGSAEKTGLYGPLTNGQRIIGHLPVRLQEGIKAQTAALMHAGALPPALREMIIVRTGYRSASLYEVVQHSSLARRLGVSQVKLDALACTVPLGLEPAEHAAIDFVDELVQQSRPGDAALASARRYYSDGEILEIVFVTGTWWTLARMLETAGVPLDEDRIGDRDVGPAAGRSQSC